MVDETLALVENDVFNNASTVRAYKLKYTDSVYADTTYVTALLRFRRAVSALQVYNDFICKHYSGRRKNIDLFSIWHPTQSEIRAREISDDIGEDDHFMGDIVTRDMLWYLKDGEYTIY
ncbi:Hypothetical predicted protein [Paramuricea clavata]|uniref:Uncharacterized protein n=1 Tax=Paramuricea clavata TaxID=317549 RepID=A0A6S7FPT8_PARCT|nr:Hypothetical predicted protein [Paramuricea clavata]